MVNTVGKLWETHGFIKSKHKNTNTENTTSTHKANTSAKHKTNSKQTQTHKHRNTETQSKHKHNKHNHTKHKHKSQQTRAQQPLRFKSMRVGSVGLGTYPSQILRLLHPFLDGSIKYVPRWQLNILSGQMSRFEAESKNEDFYDCRKIQKCQKIANFDDEIDILLGQNGAGKIT